MKLENIIVFIFIVLAFANCRKPDGPSISSIDPMAAPADSLAIIEGSNLADILEMRFSDQVVNFNTAYNSDHALLFRVPRNVPLGDHIITLETEGGAASIDFRVTLVPPQIYNFFPESAAVGEEITIYGENFYAPVAVYFFDSIQATITNLTEDSIRVIVPPGIKKGSISVVANGGTALSPVHFFSTNTILINDFDGNGVRSATNNWIFIGTINQNANTAIQNSSPDPIDGNFVKITGSSPNGWIGGFQNHSWDTETFNTFDITADNNNTLFEMDINTNGNEHTHIIVIMLERDGSPNDFAHQIHLTGDGWQKISFPLSRPEDLNGLTIDPSKIHTVKIHLNNVEAVGTPLEVNVDNMKFVEIL